MHPHKSHDPPLGRATHDLITWKREHKLVTIVWEFDCLHFAQSISIRPHDIESKHTWYKNIYCINRATWLNPVNKYLSIPHSQFSPLYSTNMAMIWIEICVCLKWECGLCVNDFCDMPSVGHQVISWRQASSDLLQT